MTQDVGKKITPDWDIWGKVPVVQLWEAVALSLCIEPERLRVAPVEASTLRSEFVEPTDAPDFGGRLFVAERNTRMGVLRDAVVIWPEGGLSSGDEKYFASGGWVMLKESELPVKLSKFVAWARSIDWKMPPELVRLDESVASTTSWPWGNYTTKLLGHLDAAVREFWLRYDPNDPSSAPTKPDVVRWLQARKVSANAASGIDTIIRAEGLPHGPRKGSSAT